MQILRQVLSRTAFSPRGEQRGATHINLPIRSVGILLACGVGAAWALSPGGELRNLELQEGQPDRQIVIEGEPQAVAVLAQSLYGTGVISDSHKRLFGMSAPSDSRLVFSIPVGERSEVRLQERNRHAAFSRAVEELEAECSLRGGYPAIPPSEDAFLTGLVYRYSQDKIELACDGMIYCSETGFRSSPSASELEGNPSDGPVAEFQGSLESSTTGWGPWSKEVQEWNPRPSAPPEDSERWSWLEELQSVGRESARIFFPVHREATGYLFRDFRGETPYRRGELMYDRLTGSFLLKLHRNEDAMYQERDGMDPALLLADRTESCFVVGDSALIESLGFGGSLQDGTVALVSDVVMQGSPLDALTAARLSSFRVLSLTEASEGAEAKEREGAAEGSALVAGRLHFADGVGQVHRVDLRAGQAVGYDWVLGQFSEVEEVAVWGAFQESVAYDPGSRTKASSVIAGE